MGPIYTIFFALHSSPICLFIGSVIFPQALTDHDAHELPTLIKVLIEKIVQVEDSTLP